jgi:hypothetical protein
VRTVAILAIAFAVFAIAAAQTSCSDAFDDFSTSCLNADGSTPFCVSESASFDITANRKCSECRPGNSCDCPLDHYCVGAPGATRGTCKKLANLGEDCFPFSGSQLTSGNFPDDKKCADLFTVAGITNVDGRGYCINGKCQACNPGNGNTGGQDVCGPQSGLGPARFCGWPGSEFSADLTNAWVPAAYIQDRSAVWLALFFPLLLFMTIFLGTMAWSSCCKSK